MRLVSILIIATSSAGCFHAQSVTYGIDDPQKMVAILSAEIPVGTSLVDAESYMQREGFHCSLHKNDRWGDRTGIDYIYCDRSKSASFPVTRRWQIAILHDDEAITEIIAKTGLIGP